MQKTRALTYYTVHPSPRGPPVREARASRDDGSLPEIPMVTTVAWESPVVFRYESPVPAEWLSPGGVRCSPRDCEGNVVYPDASDLSPVMMPHLCDRTHLESVMVESVMVARCRK